MKLTAAFVSCHMSSLASGGCANKQTHHFVILQVGTHAMDSTLLKYSAKDHFFKAALCHFCVDMLNAKVSRYTEFVCVRYTSRSFTLNVRPLVTQLAVQKYEEMFPAFSDSRECKLLKVSVAVNVPF